MTSRVPIFVISFNRGRQLRRAVASYRTQDTPVDVVVHDNGSDDAQTLEILDELQRDGHRVVRGGRIGSAADLERVDDTVAAYFGRDRRRGRYVVTDGDIELAPGARAALAVYGELLDRIGLAECVGPMLRIDDVPSDYPLYNCMLNRHIEQFWRHPPRFLDTSLGPCAVLPCIIDTTFALHREGSRFRRLKPALRVYAPYDALHLDWYPAHADANYRSSSNPAISHWNNRVQLERHSGERLRFSGYHTVVAAVDGRLHASWIDLHGG
jgi:glycosyltransferase involved in cell wall biosynthesis